MESSEKQSNVTKTKFEKENVQSYEQEIPQREDRERKGERSYGSNLAFSEQIKARPRIGLTNSRLQSNEMLGQNKGRKKLRLQFLLRLENFKEGVNSGNFYI